MSSLCLRFCERLVAGHEGGDAGGLFYLDGEVVGGEEARAFFDLGGAGVYELEAVARPPMEEVLPHEEGAEELRTLWLLP